MQITITYATADDSDWLEQDQHIQVEKLRRKINDQEVLIARSDNKNIGWLRFGFFWDILPFMNILHIEEKHRKQGIGKQLVNFWEEEMKKQGHKTVMTSSLSDEEAQHFYRKLGYSDAGSLLLPKEALEIIFVKQL